MENVLYDATMTLCISLWIVNFITIYKKRFDFRYLNCSCVCICMFCSVEHLSDLFKILFYETMPKMK